jgi:uncharacterized protein YcfJ
MKKIISSSLLVAALSLGFMQPVSAGQTNVETVIGYVNSVELVTSSYLRQTPNRDRICRVESVPVYGQAKSGNGVGGAILGGVIGSVLGNAVTDRHGAGTFGALAGAAIGHETAKNQKTQGDIIGYREREICAIETSFSEERVEKVTGYRLNVSVDGEEISIKTNRRYDVGDRIEIRRKTAYSVY